MHQFISVINTTINLSKKEGSLLKSWKENWLILSDNMIKMTSFGGFIYLLLTLDELDRIKLREIYGNHALSSKDIVYRDNNVVLLKLPKFGGGRWLKWQKQNI